MKALLCFGFALSLAAGQPGTITYGPPPTSPVKPQVLVYIHGWSAGSDTWTVGNDMPKRASQAGYRTAFVDLYSDRSMWDNGTLLAQELRQIMAHYGTTTVTLVAHSKGGVDAQTCAVYNGMAPHISQIITLGTPHHGTPLADLAWSSWAGWLAGLIGQKNEGNRVLQTGYMAWYRGQTDGRPESRSVPMATAAGTKAGPFFSMYYWGGLAIGGTSDGVVPLSSTHNPNERKHLFDRSWNHGELPRGVNTWAYLQAQIPVFSLAMQAPVQFMDDESPALPTTEPDQPLDRIYRGGQTSSGLANFEVPVDPGQPLVHFILQTSETPLWARAVSPSGRVRMLRAHGKQGPLAGAKSLIITLPAPEPGLWRVSFMAQEEDAYFFMAQFPGDRRSLGAAEARAMLKGNLPLRPEIALDLGIQTETRRVTAPPSKRNEPAILNHTMTLTWPNGRERSVILSEAEAN
jgi:triacylglycerol lipase